MNLKYLALTLCFACFIGCKKQNLALVKIEGKQIAVSDSLEIDTSIEDFIKPYREHVNSDLDSVLSYAPNTYSKKDGEYNTAIGNLFADATYKQANPVFNKRTGKNIDIVLLNHGGIRSIISKGPITSRTAYEIMPFENSLVVAALKGNQIDSLTNYLSKAKRAHPIQGLKLVLNSDFSINDAKVNNKTIDPKKTYYVATNDYLLNGGDHMNFFKARDTFYDLNYKIRNVLLDYFKSVDTINPVIDDRFTQIK